MSLAQVSREFAPAAVQASLDDTIIRLVSLHDGIKDTHLSVAVLAETATGIHSTDPTEAAEAVVRSIHNLIQTGRLMGVDCETPCGGFTLVLPARSKPTIAIPIFIGYSGTRH